MSKTSANATLRCSCGTVQGIVTDASPRTVNRVVCYCDDCQAFARFLGRPDLLDAAGGSDIIQLAAGRMSINRGEASIRGVRLSPEGSYRWYATCCKTPIGNMPDMKMPGLGVHSMAFRSAGQNPDRLFGKPIGSIRGEYANGTVPPGSKGLPLRVMLPALLKVLMWKVCDKGRPHPFLSGSSKKIRFPFETLDEWRRITLTSPHELTF